MRETIADLRASLFAAMRGLTDKDNPIEIERARAVSDIAQTIINTAKVEIEHLKITGGKAVHSSRKHPNPPPCRTELMSSTRSPASPSPATN